MLRDQYPRVLGIPSLKNYALQINNNAPMVSNTCNIVVVHRGVLPTKVEIFHTVQSVVKVRGGSAPPAPI